MGFNITNSQKTILRIILICIAAVFIYLFKTPLIENLIQFYNLLSDRENIKIFLASFGSYAPIVFIAIQIMQVLVAPIPGEVTSFIGGYLFGSTNGFLYSSIGLSVGSMLNFGIGRFLGKRYIRHWLPEEKLKKFDQIIRRQGAIIVGLLFIFPGFPKDYLCLFLGITAIPLQVFIALATFGRMPGTFMLSLQGDFLYDEMYGFFIIAAVVCVILCVLAYRYREQIYRWIERYR